MTDNKKIFGVFIILCGIITAVLLLSGAIYWAVGFAGVLALMLVFDWLTLSVFLKQKNRKITRFASSSKRKTDKTTTMAK